MDDLLRKLRAPLLQETQVLLLVPEIVREHNRNLVNDGVVAAALRASHDAR